MKKVFLCMLLFSGALALYPQTTLSFCVEVAKDGFCQNKTNEFAISKNGGTIAFLLKNKKGLGATKVIFKIFKLTENGQEVYNTTLEDSTEKSWTYAWQEAVFYDPGSYKVKVYDVSSLETAVCTKEELPACLGDQSLLCINILKLFVQ